MPDDAKRCNKCGIRQPLSNYYRATSARDGHRGECIDCARVIGRAWYQANRVASIPRVKQWQQANSARLNAYRRVHNATPERRRTQRDAYYRRTFGISADEFDAMLETQGGGCAICGIRPEREASLHVDHCHESSRVRGILCLNCNQGVGKFGDNPDLLERAASYLRAG